MQAADSVRECGNGRPGASRGDGAGGRRRDTGRSLPVLGAAWVLRVCTLVGGLMLCGAGLISLAGGWLHSAGGTGPASTRGATSAPTRGQAPAPARALVAAPHREDRNLMQNSGFEHDWSHRRFAENRRFLLLQSSDLGVGEQDGVADHWRLEGAAMPAAWDTAAGRSGGRALRLAAGARARQWVRGAGEQFWQTGGAYYQDFLPLARELAVQLPRRPLVAGAWCRTDGAAAANPPRLEIRVECAVRQTQDPQPVTDTARFETSVPFTGGTHGWEYKEIRVDPAQFAGTPQWIVVSVTGAGEGITWFDDVSLIEAPLPTERNPLPNPGFEETGADGWPARWGRSERWTWFRSEYYLFTGWTHSENKVTRGGAVPDPWIAFSGERSLRCTVYPGDNLAVASQPIELNQDRPRPIELRAMVKTDRLRTLELMGQDERGEWLPQGDFLGDDMEDNPNGYKMGTTGSGTEGWRCVRKFLAPRRPVRTLRVFLCARGFDGVRVEKNQVGTVWWDDVEVLSPGVNSGSAPPTARVPALRITDLDPGDRLWGRNEFRLDLELLTAEAVRTARSAVLKLEVTDPDGKVRSEAAAVPRIAEGRRLPTRTSVVVPYPVQRLCRTWQEQYRLRVSLQDEQGAALLPPWEGAFGTPSRLLEVGQSAYCPNPGETSTLYARLNVARSSLAELERCELLVGGPDGTRALRDVREFGELLRPQAGPDYLDTSRLLQTEVREQGLPLRSWQEPIRDHRLRVRLLAKGSGTVRVVAEAEGETFGFMEKAPPPALPGEIRRTGVDARGFMTVNGSPYYPVFWTPHFGVLPEANYHPRALGYQCADLTEIVYSKQRAPDAEVKARLQAKVRELRVNPKLFQYELGEGEMQLQDRNWKTRVAWLKTAIGWIREADPDHLISGPESWLIGHPGHNEALPEFLPDWDVVGVEASFERVPELRRVTAAAQRGKRTAVLVGLETYFYQNPEVLRWRGYRAITEGAAGVGLCPSGMLQARPDRVNFLRGLNGEFRGLTPFLLGTPPAGRITADAPGAELLEREAGGKRVLIATRAPGAAGALTVRFTAPSGVRFQQARVRFEGRSLPITGGAFQDSFPGPYTVRVYELE